MMRLIAVLALLCACALPLEPGPAIDAELRVAPAYPGCVAVLAIVADVGDAVRVSFLPDPIPFHGSVEARVPGTLPDGARFEVFWQVVTLGDPITVHRGGTATGTCPA